MRVPAMQGVPKRIALSEVMLDMDFQYTIASRFHRCIQPTQQHGPHVTVNVPALSFKMDFVYFHDMLCAALFLTGFL